MDLLMKDDEDEKFPANKRQGERKSSAHVKPPPRSRIPFFKHCRKGDRCGPAGIHQAQRTALRQGQEYYEDAVDYWRKETDYLKQWSDTGDRFLRARER